MADHASHSDPGAQAIADAVRRERLGDHLAGYQPVSRMGPGARTPAIVITSIGVALTFFGLLADEARAILLVIGLPFAVMGAIGLLRGGLVDRRQTGMQLHLFAEGLVVIGAGGRPSAFRWDGLTVLQNIVRHHVNGVYRGTTYRYTLTGHAGEPIVIGSGFAGAEQWGPAIQERVTRAQLPRAFEALQSGQALTFGDLTVNRDGIAAGRGSYRWAQVEGVEIKDGVVRIRVAGKWLAASATMVSQIPNFFVFHALAEHLRESES